MATAMKRLGVYLGLVEDDPGYDGGYGYPDPARPARVDASATAPPVPRPRPSPRCTTAATPVRSSARPARTGLCRASSSASASTSVGGAIDPYAIHTIHPRSYNDARRIGEEYRAGSPVIMNLSEMTDSDAKRIVDFAAGLVFAMHGSIERVTQKVFLLSPANVDVRDAPAVQQARDGFFNQS